MLRPPPADALASIRERAGPLLLLLALRPPDQRGARQEVATLGATH